MYDYAVIGGGIVGLATGLALTYRFPHAKILVIEKEETLAAHQTGRNSGVIHSGIYYSPGSLKARFAREGNEAMVRFCEEQGINFEKCGKVIVATDPTEMPFLEKLYKRGVENGLAVRRLTGEEVRGVEPYVSGIAGIHVPSCGIVDYTEVSRAYARIIQEKGGEISLQTRVDGICEEEEQVILETNHGDIKARYLINCAGLHSDRIAQLCGVETGMRIVPFRGEYYELAPGKRHLVNHLIYPVPNPDFPFLGVHFTRMVNGEVHAGPNAVLSLKREGYRKTDFSMKDLGETLSYPGFWRLAGDNIKEGMKEMIRSMSKQAFLKSLQRLIPELEVDDIVPSAAGVRAQALLRNGRMVDDFAIFHGKRSLHVCNAPSPAATASLMIGHTIAERVSNGNK